MMTAYKDELESYVWNYVIFIDTCSLLEDSAQYFWTDIKPLLAQNQKKINIPMRCIEELIKHKTNHSSPELAEKAKRAIDNIMNLMEDGFIQLWGDKSDNFADNVFITVFTQKRVNHKLFLITQDNALAQDILNINNSKSVRGYPVVVKRLDRSGKISDFSWSQNTQSSSSLQNNTFVKSILSFGQRKNTNNTNINTSSIIGNSSVSTSPRLTNRGNQQSCFRICKNVTTIPDTAININYIPQENDYVFTDNNKKIQLVSKIASGGEGTIFTTDGPYVAKIYHKGKNTRRKSEKIDLLISKKIQCEGICFPLEKIYNERKEYVGFLMPKAKGKELQKSIFIKPLFQKNFPNWKKIDTVELCITILKKIRYLHSNNIIMGDINPLNILVVSPQEVYFVDADSYQIEDFPCPVGTIPFTAPEIQNKKDYSNFLRSKGNEYFAIATLLFMIMLPGKPPYAQQGGADQAENIKAMDFSYPLGENSNKKTPEGPWRYIWSHLPYKVKEAFYNTFRKDGNFSDENSRLDTDKWLDLFQDYKYLLESGRFRQQDEMSEDLFPTRFKKSKNINYVVCKICGNEVAEDYSYKGICANCQHKVVYKNVCVDCGEEFEVTAKEAVYFEENNYDYPIRCKSCRAAKKQRNEQYNSKSRISNNKQQSDSGSGCSSLFMIAMVISIAIYFGVRFFALIS